MAKKKPAKKKSGKKTPAKKTAKKKTAKKTTKKTSKQGPSSYSYVSRALRRALIEQGRDPNEAPDILEKVYNAFRKAVEES